MKYKAIIFDLDGTLLNTIDDLADSMNCVLESMNYPTHETEKYKYFIGDGMINLVKRVLPKEVTNQEVIEQCHKEMLREYALRWANKTKPYSGIPELLDKLRENGIKTAILSNKPHEFTKDVVTTLLPGWNFEVVLGERKGIPRKPDPSGALEISRLLKIPPECILYVGDTSTDMLTANSAGMYAAGVLWGFRQADELLENGAKAVISEPLKLLELL